MEDFINQYDKIILNLEEPPTNWTWKSSSVPVESERIKALEEKVQELEKKVGDLDWLKKVLEAGKG